MATFDRLDQVGLALAARLGDEITPSDGVRFAQPNEQPTATESIRVSLLWVTPQPFHRNDPWVRGSSGAPEPPPLILSAVFLITTYGESTDSETTRSVEFLGHALRVFHSTPTLSLPGDTSAALGDGRLNVAIVPIELETMEKVYTPLQVRHRPWALIEAGPIQLAHLSDAQEQPPVVLPGGIRLGGGLDAGGATYAGDVTPISRPVLERVTPSQIVADGEIRIDGGTGGRDVERAWVGGEEVTAVTLLEDGVWRLTVPTALGTGVHKVRIEVGVASTDPPVQQSESLDFEVLEAGYPSVDAPAATTHSIAGNLVLTGADLGSADAVLVWPDAGISRPDDLVTITTVTAAAASVTVAAADLASVAQEPCRIVVRINRGTGSGGQPLYTYTPYVLLEFTA